MSLIERTMKAFAAAAASLVLLACSPDAADANGGKDADAAHAEGPAMWRVHDADSDIYLFGTFHVLPVALRWTTPAFDAAMKETPVTMTEVDTKSPGAQLESARLVQELGINPKGVTLSSTLGPERAERLKKVADRYGVPMAALENFRPWLAMLSLSVFVMQKEGFDAESGAEETILERAKEENDTVDYLETVDFQIRALASLDEKEILADFDESLDQIDDFRDYTDRVLKAWSNGDVKALEKETIDDMREGAPGAYKILIADRNRTWVGKIEDMLKGDKDYFIAVGAGHLIGEGGVVDLLRKDGVEVDRVQ